MNGHSSAVVKITTGSLRQGRPTPTLASCNVAVLWGKVAGLKVLEKYAGVGGNHCAFGNCRFKTRYTP